MKNCIKIPGRILFDPKNVTNKQERQSEWKKTAMVLLEPDLKRGHKGITEYYAWFINKRYNLPLNKPIRNAHVTFINDRASDMSGNWEDVKNKWQGKEIEVVVHVDPFLGIKNRKGDYLNWWLTVPFEFRGELHSIRKELGLTERPYFGLHMTIGTANNFYPNITEDFHAKKQYITRCMGMYEEYSEYLIRAAQNDNLNLGEIPIYKRKHK